MAIRERKYNHFVSCFSLYFLIDEYSLVVNFSLYPSLEEIVTLLIYVMQQRLEVPQHFRRLLSSKLRRLVAQGKLEKVIDFLMFKRNYTGNFFLFKYNVQRVILTLGVLCVMKTPANGVFFAFFCISMMKMKISISFSV